MAERQHITGKPSAKSVKRGGLPGEADDIRAKFAEAASKSFKRAGAPKEIPFEKLEEDALAAMTSSLQEILDLLGGDRIFESPIRSELDAHELLRRGLPRGALNSLIDQLRHTPVTEVSAALGMSVRTFQRHKTTPVELLDVQQSGRAWKFAEVLAQATRVLGSQDEAEQWLKRPAIGLDQRRPVDLLTTPAGVKLVEDYLGRLEYDVYT